MFRPGWAIISENIKYKIEITEQSCLVGDLLHSTDFGSHIASVHDRYNKYYRSFGEGGTFYVTFGNLIIYSYILQEVSYLKVTNIEVKLKEFLHCVLHVLPDYSPALSKHVGCVPNLHLFFVTSCTLYCASLQNTMIQVKNRDSSFGRLTALWIARPRNRGSIASTRKNLFFYREHPD
jgi:hypothetical protein